MPNLFRSLRKGVECGPYKYMDEGSGKIVSTGTEDKDLALQFMSSKGLQSEVTRPSFSDLASALTPTPSPTPSSPTPEQSSPSTPTPSPSIPDYIPPSEAPTKPEGLRPEKPRPGTIRKNGLAELSPSKIAKLKESLAAIVASGNIDAIRLAFSFMGLETADLDPNGQALLGLGWEAQLEELFVNGLPPPWLILIIANITLTVKLGLSAKSKNATPAPVIRTANGNTADK